MAKLVAWLVLIFIVLFALRLINLRNARRRHARPTPVAPAGAPMVRCARCGVYLPRAEALPVGSGFACADGQCAGRN
jgi:uncharacterized protein